jgi:hypothetical protein
MRLRRFVTLVSTIVAMSSAGMIACSDDDEEEEHEHGHDPESPSCAEIMDVCHAADEGSGPAHDCHNIAHDDVEAACAEQKDSCITTCEDALG